MTNPIPNRAPSQPIPRGREEERLINHFRTEFRQTFQQIRRNMPSAEETFHQAVSNITSVDFSHQKEQIQNGMSAMQRAFQACCGERKSDRADRKHIELNRELESLLANSP